MPLPSDDSVTGPGRAAAEDRGPDARSPRPATTHSEPSIDIKRMALDAAANGIIITDAAGRIEWANPAFSAMTGYAADEILGQTPRFLKSGKQADTFYRDMWETIVAGYVWSGEVVNRRKDGTFYVEEQTITPVPGENGRPAHFIAIKHDITERRRAEDELRRRHKELTILNLVGSALSSSLMLSDVLASCRGLLASMLEGAGGAIYLIDGETSRLKLETAWGEGERDRELPDAGGSPHACVGPAGAVLIHSDRICVPLLAQGKLLGILSLRHPLGSGAPLLDAPFYEALGRELGAAIQNALLFKEAAASRERAQALARRLVDAQEAERRHISRELHDEAAQVLMGLKLGLSMLERDATHPDVVRAQLVSLQQMAGEVLDTLRNLAMDLRPASLEHLGLRQAIQQYAESIGEKHAITVDFEATGSPQRLPSHVENALYRIVQEALANVVRHARASRVDILLEQGRGRVLLMIEDDGIGLRPAEALSGAHGRLGLLGIRERVEMLGGTLRIESAPGAGTTIVVEAPYDSAHPDRR